MTNEAKRILTNIHYALGTEPMSEIFEEYKHLGNAWAIVRNIVEWAYENNCKDVLYRMTSLKGKYRHLVETMEPEKWRSIATVYGEITSIPHHDWIGISTSRIYREHAPLEF